LIEKAIIYYKVLGCKVGINHIVSSIENIEYIDSLFGDVDNILLIREKPETDFNDWDKISYGQNFWIEGCRKESHCEQGILSFHIDYNNYASICSNLEKKIPYSTLEATWRELKQFRCDIRDSQSSM